MRAAPAVLAVLLLASAVAPAAADESGGFIVTLGQDTVGAERYTRGKDRLEVFQVGRSPRVLRRHYVYDFKDGSLTHLALVVTPPGSGAPTQTVDAKMDGDSLRGEVKNGSNPPSRSAVAVGPGTLFVGSASPWSGYESLMPTTPPLAAELVSSSRIGTLTAFAEASCGATLLICLAFVLGDSRSVAVAVPPTL